LRGNLPCRVCHEFYREQLSAPKCRAPVPRVVLGYQISHATCGFYKATRRYLQRTLLPMSLQRLLLGTRLRTMNKPGSTPLNGTVKTLFSPYGTVVLPRVKSTLPPFKRWMLSVPWQCTLHPDRSSATGTSSRWWQITDWCRARRHCRWNGSYGPDWILYTAPSTKEIP
jgi:hypothetical protein